MLLLLPVLLPVVLLVVLLVLLLVVLLVEGLLPALIAAWCCLLEEEMRFDTTQIKLRRIMMINEMKTNK